MTKIAAVILADTGSDLEQQARVALSKGADLAELRLDHLRVIDAATIRSLASAIGSRSIATLRSPAEGGAVRRPGADRDTLLTEICSHRFAYVDIELEADRGIAEELAGHVNRNRGTVIVSRHFADPEDVSRVGDALEACAALGQVAKVAVPAADLESAIQLVDLARSQASRKRRIIVIGMGDAGVITRALAEDAGQEIQYAAWGRAAALGQLSLAAARRLRRGDPRILGLVGHPLGHSLSPAIHEAALDETGFPGVYLSFDVDAAALGGILEDADRLRIRGFNVTIPHKEAIVARLDELDGEAERLGAVNTVVIENGWTVGHNTDAVGFRRSLRLLGLRVGGRRGLVIGAGGAARAVVDVLMREGARVQVTGRTIARVAALAAAFDDSPEVVPPEVLDRAGPWDLMVNATPIGTKGFPEALPVPEGVVAKAGFVYDLAYNPPTTALLAVARRLGKPCTSGLEMLLLQAAKSFELWTGHDAPVDAMRRAAKEALR